MARFVRCAAVIDAPYPAVEDAVLRGAPSWLGESIETGLRDMEEIQVRLSGGPFHKQATLRLRDPHPCERGLTLPFRLEAASAKGLFPQLDADLILESQEDGTVMLLLEGSYRPPMDGFGMMVDSIVLHRLGEASLQGLVDTIAAELSARAAPDRSTQEAASG